MLDQQGQRDLKGVAACLRSEMEAQRLHELGQDEHDGDLLSDEGPVAAPPVMQPEEGVDGQKRPFDLPASRVQAGDLAQGQLEGIEQLGEVPAQALSIVQAHQARHAGRWPSRAEPSQTPASKSRSC